MALVAAGTLAVVALLPTEDVAPAGSSSRF
jgi:hypothetical protein